MKVYFQITGAGPYGKNKEYCHSIQVYIEPTGDGHAYKFSNQGEKYMFAWVNTENSLCIDSSELPKDLWFSIKHGVNQVYQVKTKDKNGYWENDNKEHININSLIYEKVNVSQVRAYNKVMKELPNITTIEQYKAIYPLIKKGGRVSSPMIKKLFELTHCKTPDVYNGEIGIAFYKAFIIWKELVKQLKFEQ